MAVSRPATTLTNQQSTSRRRPNRRKRANDATRTTGPYRATEPLFGPPAGQQNTRTKQSAASAPATGESRGARRSRSDRGSRSGPDASIALSNEAVTPVEVPDGMTFGDLGVPAALVAALGKAGVTTPFPIQAATLPDSLAGRDVLGRGRTGSGKTYAFVLPMLARLAASGAGRRANHPRALVLAPTRELATQIQASIEPLGAALGLRTMTIFGGVGHGPQRTGLRRGVDIVVACPGRLEDHLRAGDVSFDAIELTVLDEADHMADLGFLPAVRRILSATPAKTQRLLFSATLDGGIDVLVREFLTDPVTHGVDSARSPVAKMSHHVLHVDPASRLPVLADLTAAPGRTLVFTRTKYGAKSLAKKLVAQGVPAVELHGNLSQNARTRNLAAFAEGTARTLVATDIAARGIHVDDVTLVIHADPPVEHKAYLHRSGRTARAGAEGTVVTLMTDDQAADVRDLTRKAGIRPTTTKVTADDPFLRELAPGDRAYVAPELRDQAAQQKPARRSGPRRATRSAGTPRSAAKPAVTRGAGKGTPARAATGGAAAFSAGASSRRRPRSRAA